MLDWGLLMNVMSRPVGVSIIAVIWLIGGLINIYSGLDSLVTSIELSAYRYGGWYSYGVPFLGGNFSSYCDCWFFTVSRCGWALVREEIRLSNSACNPHIVDHD